MRSHSIPPEAMNAYIHRVKGRLVRQFALTAAVALLLMVVFFIVGSRMDISLLPGLVIVLVVLGIMYFSFRRNLRFARLIAEHSTVAIGEEFVIRTIDLGDEERMNVMQRELYLEGKRLHRAIDQKVRLSEIKALKEKRHDLMVIGKHANRLTGRNLVAIPKETEGYQEIKASLETWVK